MRTPIPVTIVRPDWSASSIVGRLIGGILGLLLIALVVWLLAPQVWAGYPLGYWQTVALVVIVRYLTGSGSSHLNWSRGAKDVA